MKRSTLKRGKPLERRTELKRTPMKPGERIGLSVARGHLNNRRRKPISPASAEQRRKVKGQACLGCGREAGDYVSIDPAHIVPRSLGGCDSDLCVIPLCRTYDGGCHRAYDSGDLDLLSRLVGRYAAEMQHALGHLDGSPHQLIRITTGERQAA